MTIDKLENYYGIASGLEAIEQEIATLYSPISSPNGRTDGSYSTTPGDPTARTAMRIIQLREKLEHEHERLMELAEEIEQWLITVSDTEIVSIIRWHYLLRCNWRVTNLKVYGYPDYFYSRQKVIAYFKRES